MMRAPNVLRMAAILCLSAAHAAAAENQSTPPADGPGYYLPKQVLRLETTTQVETTREARASSSATEPCDSQAPAYPLHEKPPADATQNVPKQTNGGSAADPPAPATPEILGKLCIDERVVTTRSVDAQLKVVPDVAAGFRKLGFPSKPLADVKMSVELRDGSLLRSFNSSSQGRAGDLIIGIAKIAGTVLSGGVAMLAQQGAAEPRRTDCNPFLPPFDDQPDALRLLLSRNATACRAWLELDEWSDHANRLAADVKAQEEKLEGVNGGAELDQLVTRLKELRRGADEAKKRVTFLQSAVTAMLDNFVQTHRLGTKVEQRRGVDVLELHRLPDEKISIVDGVTASSDLVKALADANLTDASDVLARNGVVVRLLVLHGGTQPGGTLGSTTCSDAANDRLDVWFRIAQPVRLQLYVAQTPVDSHGAPARDALGAPTQTMKLVADRLESVTFQGLPARCVSFKASAFANRELIVLFDDRGQLARIDSTAGSSAAAAVTALASAATTFRDEYATTIAKMAEIDDNARKLKLSDLTTKVETLKKERERIDAQLQTDGAAANFDLALKQQQLAAESAALQAQTALDTAEATLEQRKQLEQLKMEIEVVKHELELVKAKQELAQNR